MSTMKSIAAACMAAAGTLAAASASAATLQVYSGGSWSTSGTASIAGPTTASPVGNPVPCNATFTLTLTSGSAAVTGATFSGSAACTAITTNLSTTTWPVTVTGTSGTSANITISGISLHFTSPNTTCTGSISGVLANANPNSGLVNNSFTFSGSLGACTNVKSNPSTTSTKPIQYQ